MTTLRPAKPETLELRPVSATDAEFLFRVYASTRAEELARVNWDAAQREHFLRSQFAAQTQHYTTQYPGAEFQVVLADGQPAGRLTVQRRPEEIRVMDIALLPGFRQRGLGTALLKELLAEGARTNRCVSIHVEIFNPARHWYERLGFQPVAENGVYLLMEWRPSHEQDGAARIQPHAASSPTLPRPLL
jgi:ribosomal protein S18 acetylase RimI-like enzyme